jgi:ataxia telangiectasia mutated family protein
MLTRFLALGNIMVISSAVRRGSYWHILEVSFHSDKYNPHIMAVFRGVSDRLGLSDPSKLFDIHVSQIAYSISLAGVDFLRCPPEVLGYKNRKACAESALHAFAPIYFLTGGHDSETIARGCRSFANHCQTAQISAADGYRDCFAVLVGYELVSTVDKIVAEQTSLTDWRFTHVDKNWLGETSFEDQMANDIDSIVVVVLRTLKDQDCQNILAELGGQVQREWHVFRALTVYRIGDMKTHDVHLPSSNAETVLRALKWLSDHMPDTDSASTTYHVVQQLLTDIQESPLVNEQLRYMNALCLWVSCHFRHFRDPVLLHTLIHGVASLLEQIDLALAAKSILEWALSQYAKVTEKDSHLANVLVRLCYIANEHAGSKSTEIAKIGEELLHWLEGQMLQLAKLPSTKNQVTKAFPAWPREPPPELESVCQDVSAHILSSVLSDQRITSNKFTLVRRLCKLSFSGDYSPEQFSRMDIWRLKDCIPSSRQLLTADMDAFASLLLSNKGQIHSFGLNPLSGQLPKHQQTRTPRGKTLKLSAVDSSLAAERSILELLLVMLDSDILSKVHMAYRVLRTLPPENLPDTESWTTEQRTVLEYFRGRSRRSPTRPPIRLHILLSSDVYVNMANDFKAWITTFATLLCDALADHSSFYSRLPTILQADSDIAEQVTPILVHILLSASGEDATASETPRVILSQFFSRILNSTTSDVSSLRAVVNIVLHLRHSLPPQHDDELAYDKWLDLDFMRLSKSAILSGAYTTALLFHELALEYSTTGVSSPSSADAENILFQIYSHIEEPDGFYGIKTQDLHHFLLKRFHHEHQWEKAFKFHGAALEAQSQGGVDTEGVLHSLYSFGFDTLALSVQQNVFDAGDLGVTSSSNMVYSLGWRTETWDLPDQSSNSGSGIALYNSLRAVSRERDLQVVDSISRKALIDEMERLRALGDEDLVGIREVAQNIMCLSQVNSLKNDLQECLKSGMLDSSLWSKFGEIDGGFEYVYLCRQVLPAKQLSSFPALENIVATRISLLRSARQQEQRQQIGTALTPFISGLMDIEKQCLTRISEAARESHNLQIALNSVIRAQKLERSPTAFVSQEFANVLWDQGEHKVAVQFLKDLILPHFPDIKSETTLDHAQKASLLARLVICTVTYHFSRLTTRKQGSWTSEACLEKPMDIWTHYFRPAASLVTELITSADRPKTSIATVYHQCAVFADRQYHTILRSPDAIKWKLYAERKEKEIQHRKEQMSRTQSGSRTFHELRHDQEKAEKLLQEDTQRYRKHNESLSTFLQQAIDMYSRCLQAADDFDVDGHIRLVSLWFANFNDNDLQDKVRSSIDRIPSRKFVFLAHQLSARLAKPANDPVTGSQDALQSLILRMCREHPFHSLYQVYCLRPSPGVPHGGRRSSSRLDPPLSQGERAAAAAEVFDRLRADSSSNQQVIDVEQVCDAYLQWAKRPIKGSVEKGRSGPYEIPSDMLILKLNDVRVPVLTVNTPVDPTLQYRNCIWISHYERTFETAGGVNIPKICYCRGSDGVKYKQLVCIKSIYLQLR